MPRRYPRRRLAPAAVLAAVVAAPALLAWAAHARFVRGLGGYSAGAGREPAPDALDPTFPPLTGREALELGWGQREGERPPTSFHLRPAAKAPGTVRVGIFGCSMIEGVETRRGEDMPTRLEELFRRRGRGRVEVVNFGVGAYGTHQTFRLWELLSRRYALDFVVVEIGPHHLHRDDTFQFQPGTFGSLHGRYVLDDGDARWVPPAGDGPDRARRAYFRLLPPWRYLRYDSRAPSLIRMLTPFAPQSRANPFYYLKARDAEREILETYAILLERMRRGSPGFVVLTSPMFAPKLRRRSPELPILESRLDPPPMLYRAAMRHPSAALNRLRAEELFAYLTGQAGYEAQEVRLSPPAAGLPARAARLGDVLSIGGVPIASLVVPKKALRSPNDPLPFAERLGDKPEIRAYLLAPADYQLVLLPLGEAPKDGAVVTLTFKLGNEAVETPFGRLEVSGAAATLRAQLAFGEGWTLHPPPDNVLEGFRIEADRRPADVRILIDGRPALKARVRPRGLLTLEPVVGEPVYIRALEGQALDPAALTARRGRVDLAAALEDGSAAAVPFLSYSVEKFSAKFPSPLRAPLRRAR